MWLLTMIDCYTLGPRRLYKPLVQYLSKIMVLFRLTQIIDEKLGKQMACVMTHERAELRQNGIDNLINHSMFLQPHKMEDSNIKFSLSPNSISSAMPLLLLLLILLWTCGRFGNHGTILNKSNGTRA